MKRFKNILVLYNRDLGAESLLARAQALARANTAKLTILEVVNQLPSDLLALLGPPTSGEPDLQALYLEERRYHLQRLAVSIEADGVPVEVEVRSGTAFLETIRRVLRHGHDLVLLTADSVQGLHSITFGSTSMHLMRKCPCPVWVMKPNAEPRFNRILAAIDPPVGDGGASPLDIKILQLASSLSRIDGCALDILHAWDLTGRDLETSRSETTEQGMKELLERNRQAHEGAVERLLGQLELNGSGPNIHVVRGEPWSIIPRFARRNAVDLIVMGTVTRTGVAGFLIGDTAEHVLQQISCSVLTVKPESFETPVKLEEQAEAAP